MSIRRAVARVATAVLVVGAVATACGDDSSERLGATEYRERATEQCTQLKDASDGLRAAQAPGASGPTVTKFMQQAADGLRDLVSSLERLTPPADLEPDADHLHQALERYADGLDDLADRVGPDGTFRTTLDANKKIVERLNGIADRATGLVTRLELAGCLLPA
ncbi:MAG: hypothetical protein WEC34_05610 [Acidimicrobiia bacterium]